MRGPGLVICALGLAVSAVAAQDVGRCVMATAAGLNEPKTLTGLIHCQQRHIDEASDRYFRQKETDVPDSVMESWQAKQRRETQAYIARHPDRADEGVDGAELSAKGGAKSKSHAKTKRVRREPKTPRPRHPHRPTALD
jgi:hypothetical protein